MSISGIDHIVILVKDIEDGIKKWQDFGLSLSHQVELKEAGIQQAFFKLGDNTFIELLAPGHDRSPINGALASRGEGIHVVALEVDDLDDSISQLQSNGTELTGVGSNQVFIHPKSANGVMVQLWPADRPHRWKDNPNK